MKEYELFDVTPNVEALRSYREKYLRLFEGDIIYKITSRSTKWYEHNKGVYTPSKIGMGIIPLISKEKLRIQDAFYSEYRNEVNTFVFSGASNLQRAKALKHSMSGERRITDYFYVIDNPHKMGSTYRTDAIKINEDVYNMIMIQFRNFIATTTPQDLSRYAKYFNVSDEAYAKFSLSDSFVDDLFRCNVMSEEDIEGLKNRLDIEKMAVLSLRK